MKKFWTFCDFVFAKQGSHFPGRIGTKLQFFRKTGIFTEIKKLPKFLQSFVKCCKETRSRKGKKISFEEMCKMFDFTCVMLRGNEEILNFF
jgi:hypothetical protein